LSRSRRSPSRARVPRQPLNGSTTGSAGRPRSSTISTCTGQRGSSSTPGQTWSRRARRIRARPTSTWASPGHADRSGRRAGGLQRRERRQMSPPPGPLARRRPAPRSHGARAARHGRPSRPARQACHMHATRTFVQSLLSGAPPRGHLTCRALATAVSWTRFTRGPTTIPGERAETR